MRNRFYLFILLLLCYTGFSQTCDYTFNLTDTFGDGWNGNEIEVLVDGSVVETLGPQISGEDSASVTSSLTDGATVELKYSTSDILENEVGLEFIDTSGNVLYTLNSGELSNFSQGDVIFTDTLNCPSCIPPSNVLASNIQTNSADFSWSDVNNPPSSGYEYVVMANDEEPNATNAVVNGSVTTGTTDVQVTGLNTNTAYDFYVRADCGGGDISPWTSKVDLCVAFTAPYSQNFDGGEESNPFTGIDCWAIAGNQSGEVDLENGEGLAFPTGTFSTPIVVEFGDVDFDSGKEAILVSPQFSDLPDHDNRISFKAAFEDASTNTCELIIGVMSDPTDANTFVELERVTSSTDDVFATYKVNLDNAASIGSSQYVAIASGAVDGGFDEIVLDDFIYEEIPDCDTPTNFETNNITNDSVELSWISPSPAPNNGYNWEIVPAGNGQGNDIISLGDTSDTSANATGLSANTSYDAYVRSNCGGGNGESIYMGPVNFRTDPAPAQGLACNSGGGSSVIFTEEFNDNDAGWTGDLGFSIDEWEIPDSSGTGDTGADNAYSGSNYMNFEATNDDVSQGSIVSPAIDLTGGIAEAELSFWMHAYGEDMGTLEVGVGTSATGPFTNEFTWSGQLQTSGSDDWVNVGVNLDDYVGETIYIQLTQIDDQGGDEGDMSIDLFEVSMCVACPIPADLTASSTTPTEVDLSWDATSPAPANGYDWEVVPAGDGQSNNVVASGNTSNTTVTATGLSSNTDYDTYVRANCGGNGQSSYIGPVSFTTPCATFTAPLSENFDSSANGWSAGAPGTINDCWSRQTANGFEWEVSDATSSETGPASDFTGGEYLNAEASNPANEGDLAYFQSPSIDLSPLSVPRLIFHYHMFGSNMGYLRTQVSDDDGITWNTESTISGEQQTSASAPWELEEVDLSAYAGQTVLIRFEAERGNNFRSDMSIDNFIVEESPCFEPTNLTSSNITAASVDLSWTASSPAPGNGYDYEIVPAGNGQGIGVVASDNVSGTSVTASGLSSNTDYDAYVRSDCGGGDVSAWSAVESFTTAADFCAVELATDPGGINSDYPNNADETITICPDDPNDKVVINFSEFSFQNSGTNCSDGLTVYDGDNTSTSTIDPPAGGTQWCWDRDDSPANGSGDLLGVSIEATSSSGCITLVLGSDGTGTREGFVASVSCESTVYLWDGATWTTEPDGSITASDNLYVNSGGTPDISSAIDANSLYVDNGASLDVEPSASLSLSGDMINNGTITFNSNASGSAQLDEFTGSITGFGEVLVERYVPKSNRAFRYIGSPVNTTGTINDNLQEGVNNTGTTYPADNENPNPGFGTHITGSTDGNNGFDATQTGNYSMFEWNETDQEWNEITSTNQLMAVGDAYALMIRGDRSTPLDSNDAVGDPTTLRFTGNLEVGEVDASPDLSGTPDHYNLVANPYQAIVDMKTLLENADATDLDDQFIYVYDPTLGTQGGYETIDLSLQDPESSPNGTADENILPNQSFFIRTTGNSPALTFRETYKNIGSDFVDTFSDDELSEMHINLNRQPQDVLVDGVTVRFDPGLTNAVNNADANEIWNFDERVALFNSNTYLSIEKRATPVENEIIQLYTGNYQSDAYVWNVDISNIDRKAVLVDNYLDTETPLNVDGETSIAFDIDSNIPASTDPFRFSIRFTNETLAVDDVETTKFAIHPNPVTNNRFSISGLKGNGDATIKLFDMNGKLVFSTTRSAEDLMTIDIDRSLQTGVYQLSVSQDKAQYESTLIISE